MLTVSTGKRFLVLQIHISSNHLRRFTLDFTQIFSHSTSQFQPRYLIPISAFPILGRNEKYILISDELELAFYL